MSGDTVTVSAKLPRDLRDGIDDIGKELAISSRSIPVRKAPESSVEEHGLSGIPTVDSEVGGGRKEIGIEEIASIPQENTNSSERRGKEEEQEG